MQNNGKKGLLEATGIVFGYRPKQPPILNNINLALHPGERLGIAAPSGYGKTTLARILAGYQAPWRGSVLWEGAPLPEKGFCPVQLVSQHPEQSVNPRWKMSRVLEEAGIFFPELPQALGIQKEWLERYPGELSGGELQRFCIARALAKGTQVLVADEISAMLDAITQAQLWNFLLKESAQRGMGLVVVTHNPNLAQQVCTRTIRLDGQNR